MTQETDATTASLALLVSIIAELAKLHPEIWERIEIPPILKSALTQDKEK